MKGTWGNWKNVLMLLSLLPISVDTADYIEETEKVIY